MKQIRKKKGSEHVDRCKIITNPIFIVSANQPSTVADTFPGASYMSEC